MVNTFAWQAEVSSRKFTLGLGQEGNLGKKEFAIAGSSICLSLVITLNRIPTIKTNSLGYLLRTLACNRLYVMSLSVRS